MKNDSNKHSKRTFRTDDRYRTSYKLTIDQRMTATCRYIYRYSHRKTSSFVFLQNLPLLIHLAKYINMMENKTCWEHKNWGHCLIFKNHVVVSLRSQNIRVFASQNSVLIAELPLKPPTVKNNQVFILFPIFPQEAIEVLQHESTQNLLSSVLASTADMFKIEF